MLRELLGVAGLTVFHSMLTPDPVPLIVTEETLAETLRAKGRQFYLCPLRDGSLPVMSPIVSGAAIGSWFIDLSNSPSMVEVMLPPHFEEDGIKLGPGSIAYPASSRPISSEIGESLREIYQNIVRILKAALLRSLKVGTRRVWVTDACVDVLAQGAQIRIQGVWIR